ncbi:MAG: hypothetical protein PHS32_21845 [Rhodoferax sp.]|uniref:hypothetical protein n=1 Tax=Rhodoferax sp. TaxID=50421 RepID=UPI00260C1946|nr:hypothetical protein [Rhodoferax sp.]MDD5336391.1 hypothetical protein [Rhodoferax sp.]
MKDFIHVRIKSDLNAEQMLDQFSSKLLGFKWRQGDSDMQGPYISGMNNDGVQVMMWHGEQPNDLTVSFSGATSSDTENRELIDQLLHRLAPSLGEVVEVLGVD